MESRAPERTERDITGLLNMAGHALSSRLTVALAEVGLSPRMQCVLVHALEQERTQIQIAALADLDKTTMVATVDALERQGLAERRASAADRRARVVSVNEKGRAAAEEGQRIVDRVHGEVLDALPEIDRAAFVQALSLLVEGAAGPPVVRRSRSR